MAGVKGRSGGARAGGGRKSKPTNAYQATMRAAFEARVTPDRWGAIIEAAVDQARAGDKDARAWLTPWVVGAVPKEITGQVDAAGRFVFVVE